MKAVSAAEFLSGTDSISWFPQGGQIELRDGRRIDVTGDVWTIPTPTRNYNLDWSKLEVPEGEHLNAIRRWVTHQFRHKGVSAASNAFQHARTFFNSPAFLEAAHSRSGIPYLAFSQAQEALAAHQRWQLHFARDFYRWCYSQQFPYFSREVTAKLDTVVIGGNAKGEAVRSADPDKGPLDAMEVASLALALRAARAEGSMPLAEQSALWLCLAFGANAAQYAMMREEDITPEYVNGQLIATLVAVPRHKKRDTDARAEFQTRKVNRFVGQLLGDLIRQNEADHPKSCSNKPRPLFWRIGPTDRGRGLEEWEWHLNSKDFTSLVARGVKRLRVLSRSGGQLNINTRRLRYTVASRMVQAGASKWAVAAALDHSDLQNVDTYFDVDDGIVEHLDRTMALALGVRAQAFATIVEKENDAQNGDKPGSRRYFGDREKDIFEPIGTCGHSFVCNVSAPYGCYVCPKFQAWMDGPHDLVLDALVEARNRREELGLDRKIVAIEDELIAHVASVITRIAEIRDQGGKGA